MATHTVVVALLTVTVLSVHPNLCLSVFGKYYSSQSSRLGSTDILVSGILHPGKTASMQMKSSWFLTINWFWNGSVVPFQSQQYLPDEFEGWTRWPTEVPSNPYYYSILSFCFRVSFTSASINLRHGWHPAPLILILGISWLFACIPFGITERSTAYSMCCNLAAILLFIRALIC